MSDLDVQHVTMHGRRVAYRTSGSGEPVLMVHGITQDSTTWQPLIAELGDDVHAIAPDMPGHGRSENPAGDHSLGAYASSLRDLLFALEVQRVTLVGHSLGGGVSLQFAYQFPEMVNRLVLIDSGGLGRDVSRLLRAATLPGADAVLSLVSTDAVHNTVDALSRGLRRIGLEPGVERRETWEGIKRLADPEARHAFINTVRAVLGPSGQAVSARDRLYLAAYVPTLIVWGAQDGIIPLHHATTAHEAIEGSWLRVIPDAGHFPHVEHPEIVADHLRGFIAETEPADVPRERWGEIMRANEDTA